MAECNTAKRINSRKYLLIIATVPNVTEGNVAYTFGADQKRRSRDDGTDFTAYRWDIGFNVIEEEDDLGAPERTYVHGGSSRFHPVTGRLQSFVPIVQGPVRAILADVAGATPSTGSIRHYVRDNLGSTRGIYDGSRNQTGTWEPNPYGEVHADSLPTNLTHRFTGIEVDAVTGFYNTAYRAYSPEQNRWMTRDPLGMIEGPNSYAYVVQNPIRTTDRIGLAADPVDCASQLLDAANGYCGGPDYDCECVSNWGLLFQMLCLSESTTEELLAALTKMVECLCRIRTYA